MHHRRVHHKIDRQHGNHRAENRARNVPPRIVHLPAEVHHAVPPIVGVDHRLQRQNKRHKERPACGQHSARSYRGHRRGMVREAHHDHRQKQYRLQNRREILHAAAHLHAFPLQQRKQQDHTGGNRPHVTMRHRQQIAGVFAEDDRDGRKAARRRDPIAPPDDEPRVVAQRRPREIVLPAALRQQRPQFGKLHRPQRHIDSANGPRGKVQPRRGQQPRNLPRSAHDPGANRVSDGHCNPKAHTKRADQPPAPG